MEGNSLLMPDEEQPFSTPSPSHPTNIAINYLQVDTTNPTFVNPIDVEGYDNTFKNYLNKEKDFRPLNGYLEKLQATTIFSAARFKAIDWIIEAQTRLNLHYETSFAAVNYLDRFFSMYFNEWEMWMGAELIAVACLLIACKINEVYAPNLQDIQSEGQEHSYEPNTIKSMELRILKALDYRLICVTSYSYLDILIHRINSSHPDLLIYTAEFLLRVQLDDKLVSCGAITTAIAALQCSIERVMPFEYDEQHYSTLEQLVPSELKEEKEMCMLLMKEYIETPLSGPMSPISVLGKRKRNKRYLSIEYI